MVPHRRAAAIAACLAALGSGSAGAATGKAAAAACGNPLTGGASAVSGLPLPKACSTAQPAGTPGNLMVLPWAGFRGAISYSFDDAYPSQIENYAALKAPGIRMTFYVIPSQVGKSDPSSVPLLDRWRQVLADGNEIGNHTVNHCNTSADGNTLSNCAFGTPDAEHGTIATQISAANDFIESSLGQPSVWTMASPYGDGNYDSFATAAGFIAHRDVWTDKSASFLAPGDVANVYHLPCYAGAGASGGWGVDDKQATFEKIINDARGRGRWGIFLFHSVAPNDWDVGGNCCPVPATAIAGSMEHLKAWGDVWGDSMVNVAAYTIGQNLLASLTPTASNGSTTWTWTLPPNFPPGKYLRVTVDGGTLKQTIDSVEHTLPWNERGFYEVSLSAGNLTLSP